MRNSQYGVDRVQFIELIKFLIDNINIRFGDYVFKQIVGIPIEAKCAPRLAICKLCYHEWTISENQIKIQNDHDKSFLKTNS